MTRKKFNEKRAYVTVENLKKAGYTIERANYSQYVDDYTGRKHYGSCWIIRRGRKIYKIYQRKENLYKDLARARRWNLSIYDFMHAYGLP